MSPPPIQGGVITDYQAPRWLPGAHLQTVVPSLWGRPPTISYRRERWESTPHGVPDGDFVDVDRVDGPATRPLVVVFHGLEGCSQSPYARYLMAEVLQRNWRGLVANFRGRSGEMNRLPRAYHSGDSAEIEWILQRAKSEAPDAPLFVAGISLGGNASLKWLGERGNEAQSVAHAVAAISAPLDLAAAGNTLDSGVLRIYTRHFLKSLKATALKKLERHPGLFDGEKLRRATTLREFDNLVTAPLHGYRDTDDYWSRASSKPGLKYIAVPCLLLNARNDPFLPESALPLAHEVSSAVTRDFPRLGGHVGFMTAPFPGNGTWMPRRVFHFFEQHL